MGYASQRLFLGFPFAGAAGFFAAGLTGIFAAGFFGTVLPFAGALGGGAV